MEQNVSCSACGFDLGSPEVIEAMYDGTHYDTPTEAGFAPGEVTWLCGTHKADIDTDPEVAAMWPDDLPYWHN